MRVSIRSALLLVMVLAASFSALAQERRGPSTRQERADAVKLARVLEHDPFNKDAKRMREWFTEWLIEIPDLTVDGCPGYLEPLYQKKKKNYASVISSQMLFSSAAYMIDHPDLADDRVAVNLAGLEGALKTYQAILRKKPNKRWPFLDDLLNKRDRGELKAYVESIAATKCAGKK
jgi:hypothetical protein